jgi:hypothetical protein
METITLNINKRTKAGKAFNAMLQVLLNQSGVEIVKEKSPYNPEFVKKIGKARTEKGGKIVTAENLWQSIK